MTRFRVPTTMARSGPTQEETAPMKTWTKPAFENLRYGFEINLYVKVR